MNLPNRITLTRIFLIPIVVILYMIDFPYHMLAAAVSFALIACTDFIDGSIARKYNMVTDLGKFLDPIADKVIVVVGLFLLFYGNNFGDSFDEVGVVCAIIIMSRELIIGAFRQIAATKRLVLAADNLGKAKTVITDFAIPFLFIGGMAMAHFWVGFALFVIATLLTVVSGVNYVVKNKHVLGNTQSAETAVAHEESNEND